MKHIYTLFSAFLITASAIAQVDIQEYNGGSPSGANYNGTTITRTVSANELVVVDLGVTNTAGMDKNLSVRRLKIQEVSGWAASEQICWGYQAEGNCYTTPFISPNPWTSPAWGSPLPNGETANLKFDIHTSSAGTTQYRFYILDAGTAIDSVDVIVTTTLSIKEKKSGESLSVYPNPATSWVNVTLPEVAAGADVKITDVLGKVVYFENASTSKKISVEDFKNGVYVMSVMDISGNLQTRRFVVKH